MESQAKEDTGEAVNDVSLVTMVVTEGTEDHNVNWKTEKANLSRCIIQKIVLMTIVSIIVATPLMFGHKTRHQRAATLSDYSGGCPVISAIAA